jgi:proline iminopeptidase
MDALVKIGRSKDTLLDHVGSITCPTLVMTGELDPAAPPDDAADLVNAIGPTASLSVIPDAGHGVYRDQPDAFNARVGAFLRDLDGASRESTGPI